MMAEDYFDSDTRFATSGDDEEKDVIRGGDPDGEEGAVSETQTDADEFGSGETQE